MAFFGRIIAGISGASFTVANAYIADISTPDKKAQNFGIIGATFGLGFIIGPVIGGIAFKWGIQVTFLVAAGLSLINVVYGFIILPESLPPEKRTSKFKWKTANPIGGLKNLNRFPAVMGFIIPFFLIYIAGYAVQSTWSFFTIYEFSWDEATVGYSLAVVGIVVAIVQGGLICIVVKKFGDRKTILSGMIFWVLGLFLFSNATEPWMMFAFNVPYCLGGVAGPTLQGIISNFVPDTMHGRLQGTLTSIMSLTAILGPPLMTYIFYLFTGENANLDFPVAPFAAVAFLLLISIFLTAIQLKKMKPISRD